MAESTRPDRPPLIAREFGSLRIALDRLVADSRLRSRWFDQGGLDVDVYEHDGKTIVEASLPGYRREEIEVRLDAGVLSIRAEHREQQEEYGRNYYRRERRFGSVARRIPLPGIPADAPVDAQYSEGVLRVEIDALSAATSQSIQTRER